MMPVKCSRLSPGSWRKAQLPRMRGGRRRMVCAKLWICHEMRLMCLLLPASLLPYTIRAVTKLLEDLVFFVVDIPNNGQDVLEIMVNKPNRERQKLMREQNILKQVWGWVRSAKILSMDLFRPLIFVLSYHILIMLIEYIFVIMLHIPNPLGPWGYVGFFIRLVYICLMKSLVQLEITFLWICSLNKSELN